MSDYELINTIVNAITGIGTVGAVITSLYLARNRSRPVVDVDVTFHRGRISSTTYSGQPSILVEVTNKGIIDEYAESYGYSVGAMRLKKRCQVDPCGPLHTSFSFPSWIKPGEKVTDCISIEFFVRYQAVFFFDYLDQLPLPRIIKRRKLLMILALRSAKCFVTISRCGSISFPLGLGVRKYLVNSYFVSRGNKI